MVNKAVICSSSRHFPSLHSTIFIVPEVSKRKVSAEWGDLGRWLTLTLTSNRVVDFGTACGSDLEKKLYGWSCGRTIWLTLKEDDAIGKGCGKIPEEGRMGLGGGPHPWAKALGGAPHLTPSFFLPGGSRIL